MPRALHVLGSLNPGGVERWLLDTVRLRGDSPWAFDFCLLGPERGRYAPRLETLGCRTLPCPLQPRATFPARLIALLRRERVEVVHSHVHHFSGTVLAIARAAGVAVRAAHSHTCEVPVGITLRRRLYRGAMRALLEGAMTQGFACTEAAAGFAGERLRPRFRILACGIDVGAFQRPRAQRAELRRELGIPGDVPVVGHVGRLAEEKNHTFLLRAMARLASRVPRARLVIAGGGGLRPDLEGVVQRFGLRQRVVFTGPRDDVPELLGIFDALALPSLREGLPAVVLEAQAAGLPCVVSEQTPVETVVLPERVERIALSRGPAAWADALARALEQPRWDGGDACRRLRQSGFDVAQSFAKLTQAYEEGWSTRF
jgi:glycosyltransferase involved in cell wall biosynthesis